MQWSGDCWEGTSYDSTASLIKAAMWASGFDTSGKAVGYSFIVVLILSYNVSYYIPNTFNIGNLILSIQFGKYMNHYFCTSW